MICEYIYIYIYIHNYMYVCVYIYIYIYIYIYQLRTILACISLSLYIYIYIYIKLWRRTCKTLTCILQYKLLRRWYCTLYYKYDSPSIKILLGMETRIPYSIVRWQCQRLGARSRGDSRHYVLATTRDAAHTF